MAESLPPTSDALVEFVRIGEVAATTTHLLELSLHAHTRFGAPERRTRPASGPVGPVEQLVLQQARDYLAVAREGFTLGLRAGRGVSAAALRFLLDRVLLDWGALEEELARAAEQDGASGGAEGAGSPAAAAVSPEAPPAGFAALRHQLLASGMAAVALGMLPRTPAGEITFPYSHGQPPTYADIPAPASPAALLLRLEEMERLLWEVMGGGLQELVNRRYGPLRRTYGFFEVSALLARREAERFGVKPAHTLARFS
jgi:hypothetical protein